MNNIDDILIDKYLRDEHFSQEERAILEGKLQERYFLDLIEDRKQMITGLGLADAANMKKLLQQTEQELQSPSKKTGLSTVKKVLLLLAALAMCLALYYLAPAKPSSANAVFAAHYSTYPNVIDPLTKGTVSAELSVYQAYEQGLYTEVVATLSHKADLSSDEQFYLAMAYIEIGDLPLAEQLLLSTTDDRYNFSKQWYLSLICLKQNESDCSALFSKIASSTSSPYQAKAGEVLHQLTERKD